MSCIFFLVMLCVTSCNASYRDAWQTYYAITDAKTDKEAQEAAKKYVDAGGDVNVKVVVDYYGQSPSSYKRSLLHAAVAAAASYERFPKPQTLRYLLQQKADINYSDKRLYVGGTVLHEAMLKYRSWDQNEQQCALACIKILLASNADINAHDINPHMQDGIPLDNIERPRPLDVGLSELWGDQLIHPPATEILQLFIETGKPIKTIRYDVYMRLCRLRKEWRLTNLHRTIMEATPLAGDVSGLIVGYLLEPLVWDAQIPTQIIGGVSHHHVYRV